MDSKKLKYISRAIVNIINETRGSVDAFDFKQYVFCILFYRFLSEDICKAFKGYELLEDSEAEKIKDEVINKKRYFILPSELFSTVNNRANNNYYYNVRNKSIETNNINITLENIFNKLEESTPYFKDLFYGVDVNSNKLGGTIQKRSDNLLSIIKNIGTIFKEESGECDADIFGDAYEYILGLYSSNAGRSGGEFFTPKEVGELLSLIVTLGKKTIRNVYDPTCGTGSLLLKVASTLGKENVTNGFYGQEINLGSYNLCRMNMILHGIDLDNFNIENGDTLINPNYFDGKKFEAIVSNPPYSLKWIGDNDKNLINDIRFKDANRLSPKARSDLAFVMHDLHFLDDDGVCAIVCSKGALSRCGAELEIRKYLIKNNFVHSVICLPRNMFFGTTIETSILILKKNKTDEKILFIDAVNEFESITNGSLAKNNITLASGKNKLGKNNISNILKAFEKREDKEYYSKLVDNEEVIKNYSNLLSLSYVAKKEEETKDIKEIKSKYKSCIIKNHNLRNLFKLTIESDINNNDSFVREIELSTLTYWCTGFVNVEKIKQPRTIKIAKVSAEKLKSLKVEDGDIRLISTGKFEGYTTLEEAGDFVNFGEVVTIPTGGSANIKYHNGYFVISKSHCCFSRDTSVINTKYLYYYLKSRNKEIQNYYYGAQIQHPDMNRILRLKIKLPTIKKQIEIVESLDALNALFIDSESGLQEELRLSLVLYNDYVKKVFSF